MKKKVWQDREWLKEHYIDKGMTFKQIGLLVGKTDKTIQHFFNKHGLKARPPAHFFKAEKSIHWKGGRVYDSRGYVRIWHPEPHRYKHGRYVSEHILVMEKRLGRPIKPPEVIHHINGVPDDNRIENLQLMSTPKEHMKYETDLSAFAKGVLFGDIAPHLKDELNTYLDKFLSSSIVNER